jgi:hypothetical protein
MSIQRQFGANWLASASYLGNDTIHLWGNNPVNAPVFMGLGPCTINGVPYTTRSTTANENQRRPLYLENPAQGQYSGAILQLDPGSTASYNALLFSTLRCRVCVFDMAICAAVAQRTLCDFA